MNAFSDSSRLRLAPEPSWYYLSHLQATPVLTMELQHSQAQQGNVLA